ncbi:MAG: DUF4488 domain-containing protein [Dysgonomonas sp.]|nr:DUF4488 domain-containing protein [Dysgonomonas sp.]
MKNKFVHIILLSIFIGAVSCSSNKSVIKGSWAIVEENGYPVNRKQIKHYTDKYFIWHTMDQSNLIVTAAGGEYKIDGDELYEVMEMTMPSNSAFKGNTAKIKIKLKKDTLIQNTVIPMQNGDNKFTEKWVRIK